MTERHDIITARNDKSQILHFKNPFFYCTAERSFYSPERFLNVPEHWHEELEIIFVTEGKLHFTVNAERFELHAGEGIFVNSKRVHANWSPLGEYAVFYFALLNPSYMCASSYIEQKYVAPVLGRNSPDYLLIKENDWTDELRASLFDMVENNQSPVNDLNVIEKSIRILKTIYSNIKPDSSYNTSSSQYVDTFKNMLIFINEHYNEKISLEDIAQAGNVGKTLCSKIFKKFSGKTPGDYLIHYRITESMRLLDENKLSVTEIAYNTGFNSASHFTKTFREILGITPNKYKSDYYTN